MNKKGIPMLLLLVFSLLITGCAGLMERHDGIKEQAWVYIEDVYKGTQRDVPRFCVVDGRMTILYLTGEKRVALRSGDNTALIDEDTKWKGYARSLNLHCEGNRLYAMWWAKTPEEGGNKYLYFRVSHDGGKTFEPTRIINSGGGVLNYYFTTDGEGTFVFVYDDEREGPYKIYFNISHDYGRTWLDNDVRLDSIPEGAQRRNVFAIEPKAIINRDSIVVTWKERREEGEASYLLKSRTSNDRGKTWTEEVIIREAKTIFSSDNLIVHNNMPYTIGQENETGVSGFRSMDNGMTWEGIGAVPDTETTVNSQIKVISSGNDAIYAIWTSEAEKRKSQVWFSAYSYSENKWSEPVRLDRKMYDLTMAMSPDIALLNDGTIVAVWEDYRDIRPNIYMNTSTDNGKIWQEGDSPLGIKGRYSYTFPVLLTNDDTFFVSFYRDRGDADGKSDYLYREFGINKGLGLSSIEVAGQLSESEKEERLRQRVTTFWRLRTKGQFADTYDYHDPFFRIWQDKDTFTRAQGNITYNRFEIAEIDIKGNIANVKIEYNFEVKGVEVMGMKIVQKPTDDVLSEEWVWIYDDWYKVWENIFKQRRIRY